MHSYVFKSWNLLFDIFITQMIRFLQNDCHISWFWFYCVYFIFVIKHFKSYLRATKLWGLPLKGLPHDTDDYDDDDDDDDDDDEVFFFVQVIIFIYSQYFYAKITSNSLIKRDLMLALLILCSQKCIICIKHNWSSSLSRVTGWHLLLDQKVWS